MEPNFLERHAKKIIIAALVLVVAMIIYNAAYATATQLSPMRCRHV